jgi:hypothetical protein
MADNPYYQWTRDLRCQTVLIKLIILKYLVPYRNNQQDVGSLQQWQAAFDGKVHSQ